MRQINKVVVHCADTPTSLDIGADEIRDWHRDRGWDDIGYHYVIRRDGEIEDGRPVEVVGAHTKGHNKHSIGICLVGGRGIPLANFTANQYISLMTLCQQLEVEYNVNEFYGHYEFDSGKTCPNFNVKEFLKGVVEE